MSTARWGQQIIEVTKMYNKLNFRQTFATLILLAMSTQMLPLSIFGQSMKNDRTIVVKSGEILEDAPENQIDSFPQTKIAPDLEESVDDLSKGLRGDDTQRVIIQLKGGY